jgi:hypothetical protein
LHGGLTVLTFDRTHTGLLIHHPPPLLTIVRNLLHLFLKKGPLWFHCLQLNSILFDHSILALYFLVEFSHQKSQGRLFLNEILFNSHESLLLKRCPSFPLQTLFALFLLVRVLDGALL